MEDVFKIGARASLPASVRGFVENTHLPCFTRRLNFIKCFVRFRLTNLRAGMPALRLNLGAGMPALRLNLRAGMPALRLDGYLLKYALENFQSVGFSQSLALTGFSSM